MHQAQETFVADLSTGPVRIGKGEVFADAHEAVKLDSRPRPAVQAAGARRAAGAA